MGGSRMYSEDKNGVENLLYSSAVTAPLFESASQLVKFIRLIISEMMHTLPHGKYSHAYSLLVDEYNRVEHVFKYGITYNTCERLQEIEMNVHKIYWTDVMFWCNKILIKQLFRMNKENEERCKMEMFDDEMIRLEKRMLILKKAKREAEEIWFFIRRQYHLAMVARCKKIRKINGEDAATDYLTRVSAQISVERDVWIAIKTDNLFSIYLMDEM